MSTAANGTRRRLVVSIIVILAGLVIAGGLYLSLVPIDISSSHERIEALILEHSTHRVTIERAVLRLLPSPRLTFKGFRIIDGTDTLIYADTWDVTFTWNSLFSSVLTIKKLDVGSPELVVKRNREGVVNIVKYAKTHRPKRIIRLKSLRISDARAHVDDEYLTKPQGFDLAGFSASVDETFTGYSLHVTSRVLPDTTTSVKGHIYPSRRRAELKGYVNGLELAIIAPYMKAAGITTVVDAKVDINGSIELGGGVTALGTLEYTGLSVADDRYLTETITSPSGGADFNFSTEPPVSGLRLTDIKINGKTFSANGSASVTGDPDGRTLEATLSTTTIPVESIRRVTTVKALPASVSKAIKGLHDTDVDGTAGGVAIENLQVKGRLDELRGANPLDVPGALSASVRFDNLSFTHDARKGAFTGFNGGAAIEGKTVTLRHISGTHNKSRLRDISGTITDVTGSPSYDLFLDGQFEAGELIDTIGPTLTGGAKDGTDHGIEASGRVDVTVRARGAVEAGWPEDISATARFKDASVTHPSLPVPVEGLNGHASFNNVDILLTRLSATDGHSRLTLDGNIRNYPSLMKTLRKREGKSAAKKPAGASGISFDLRALGAVEFSTLTKIIGDKPLKGLYFDGPLSLSADISGPPAELKVRTTIDATPTQVAYRNWIKKGKNFPLTVNCEATLGKSTVKLALTEAHFGESKVRISGDFSRKLDTFDFAMDTEGMRLTDIDNLSPLLRGDYDSSGVVTMSIKGKRKNGGRPTYDGGITLKDGRFDTPLIARPVERIDAEALLTENKALVIVSSNIGTSSVNARVEFSDLKERTVHFELTSPRLNTADLLPKGVASALSGGRPAGPKPKKTGLSGGGVIFITSGNWWGHNIENFYTELKFGERTIDVHPISINVDSGDITAELIYNRDADNPVLYRLTSEISGMDTANFIASAGAKKKVLEGGLDGTVSVWGRRGVPLTSGLNGNVNLHVNRGTMWKFILFSKIFSIVNIFSIDEFLQAGLRFKALSGDYAITDGVISTENMLLDSDSMKMSAVGKIDLNDASMDAVIAMHPFVTIDKIITSLPIAGWVITGPEGSTVSMYYNIDGPLRDLNVNPVPQTKMGSKVLGIFQRILELPVQVLAPEELKKAKEKAKEKEKEAVTP